MEWLDRMNCALDYIEQNLAGEISFDHIAHLACCSKYHFQRMFPFITGVSLSEYIRRRRLTQAAYELQTTQLRIVDLALRYGYDSPEAFSRAFKSQHGVMPAAVRRAGSAVNAFPRMRFQIMIRGDSEMRYRLEKRDAFTVFGVSTQISSDQKRAFEQVPAFFRKCDEDGTTDGINALLGRFDDNYTISALYGHTEDETTYMLCNYLPKGLVLPEKYETLSVPARTWLIFDVPGCEMQAFWARIWTEFFPSSEYEIEDGSQFEMYYGLARHENGFGEIWIPVKVK